MSSAMKTCRIIFSFRASPVRDLRACVAGRPLHCPEAHIAILAINATDVPVTFNMGVTAACTETPPPDAAH